MTRGGSTTGSLKKEAYIKIIQVKTGMDKRAVKKLKKYKVDELKNLIYIVESTQEKTRRECKKKNPRQRV